MAPTQYVKEKKAARSLRHMRWQMYNWHMCGGKLRAALGAERTARVSLRAFRQGLSLSNLWLVWRRVRAVRGSRSRVGESCRIAVGSGSCGGRRRAHPLCDREHSRCQA